MRARLLSLLTSSLRSVGVTLPGAVVVFPAGRSARRALTCDTRGADLDSSAAAAVAEEGGVLVSCPPDCARGRPSVFGTGVYAAVSSICGAALHRYKVGAGESPKVLKLKAAFRNAAAAEDY